MAAENDEEHIPCKIVAKVQKLKSGKSIITILGPVVNYFSYTHPADFMHISTQPVVAGQLAGECVFPERSGIPPPIFTKIDKIDYLFNKSALNNLMPGKLKRDGATSTFNAVARFEDSTIPSAPVSSFLLPSPDGVLMSYLRKLLERRPLWLRSAMDEFLPAEFSNWKKRTAFSRVCYIFSDGPWRGCMCKLGYDPRKDPEARIYQTIDFRDPHYRSIDWKTGKRSSSNPEPSTMDKSSQDFEKIYGEFSKDVLRPNPEVHFLVAPTRPSQLYQLCDICDAGIQNVVQGIDDPRKGLRTECSKATGWYSAVEISKIREKMVLKSCLMRQQYNLKL